MNFLQVCRLVGDNKLSDLSMAVRIVNRINKDLPEDFKIDVDQTGNEAIQWFDDLEGANELKVIISLERLNKDEVQELKMELITLREQLRTIETHDHQIKHNMVMIYIALAVALGAGCLYTYMSTQGVDVESSSQILAAAKVLIGFLFELSNE